MHYQTALTAACLASTSVALPFGLSSLWSRQEEEAAPTCMTPAEVDELVAAYADLIEHYSDEAADRWLAEDFFDTSQSINTLIHLPIDGPTFGTKEIFKEKQAVGAHFPVNVLSVDIVTCDRIALQWDSTFGATDLPAKGLTILKNVYEEGVWKMASIEVEFNSLLWLINMGGSYSWEGKTFSAENIDPAILPAGEAAAPEEEAPVEEAPADEEANLEDMPTMEDPETEMPDMEMPDMEMPDMEEPAMEEPALDEPTMDEPAMEEPAMEAPEMEEPVEEEGPEMVGPVPDSPIFVDPPFTGAE